MHKSQLFELLYNWLPFFSRLLLRVHFRIQKLFRKKSKLLKFKTFFSNFSDLSWWVLLFYLDLHFSKSIIQIFKKGLFWLVRVFWYSSTKIFRIQKGCSDWFYTFTLQPLWNFSGAKAEDRQCKSMHTVGHFHSVLKENVKFSEKRCCISNIYRRSKPSICIFVKKKNSQIMVFRSPMISCATNGCISFISFHSFLTPSPSHFPPQPPYHPKKFHLFFQKISSHYPPYLFSISDNFLFLHRQISSPSPPNSSCAFLLQNAVGLSRTIGSCLGSSILDELLNLLQIDETNTFLMLNFAVSDGSKLSVSTWNRIYVSLRSQS